MTCPAKRRDLSGPPRNHTRCHLRPLHDPSAEPLARSAGETLAPPVGIIRRVRSLASAFLA